MTGRVCATMVCVCVSSPPSPLEKEGPGKFFSPFLLLPSTCSHRGRREGGGGETELSWGWWRRRPAVRPIRYQALVGWLVGRSVSVSLHTTTQRFPHFYARLDQQTACCTTTDVGVGGGSGALLGGWTWTWICSSEEEVRRDFATIISDSGGRERRVEKKRKGFGKLRTVRDFASNFSITLPPLFSPFLYSCFFLAKLAEFCRKK